MPTEGQRERERERDRESERERESETQRQRERERERDRTPPVFKVVSQFQNCNQAINLVAIIVQPLSQSPTHKS